MHRTHNSAKVGSIPSGGITSIGAAVAQLLDMEEVTGSNPVSTTCGRSSAVEHLLAKENVESSNLFVRSRGISSVGRALAWHARGQEFESPILHRPRGRQSSSDGGSTPPISIQRIFDHRDIHKRVFCRANVFLIMGVKGFRRAGGF